MHFITVIVGFIYLFYYYYFDFFTYFREIGIKWWFFCPWTEFNTGELHLPESNTVSFSEKFFWQVHDQGIMRYLFLNNFYIWYYVFNHETLALIGIF